jgi:DNA-directed RNA polymerase alpha subunit
MTILGIIILIGALVLIAVFIYGKRIDIETREMLDTALDDLKEEDIVESGEDFTVDDAKALNVLSFYIEFEALSKRAKEALSKANVYSLQELLDLDVDKDLESIKGCGPATKREIQAFKNSLANADIIE